MSLTLPLASRADAYFLDKDRNFDVRLRAYSQLGIMTDSSEADWPGDNSKRPTCIIDGKPSNKCKYSAGDLAQHRNFYNPEFDAKLTDYMRWMNEVPGLSLITPEDFKFRFAWWGFYDGLYDYLNGPWNLNRRLLKARESESDNPRRESFNFNDQNINARHLYAKQDRINEMYLDYTKGPLFLRAGRQFVSWGESDDIIFLDRINEFDLTQGAPGFFQDLDEARIPFWALRSTVKLVEHWRWLSSLFADAYVVPGVIDTTVPIGPLVGGVSPFNADAPDPQSNVPKSQQNQLHVVTVTRLPTNDWSNTRWGARLTGIVAGDYTVQGWFYRTFPIQPTPLLTGGPGAIELGATPHSPVPPTFIDDRGFRTVCLDNTTNKPIRNPKFTFTSTSVGHTPSGRPCSFAEPIVTILDRRLESVIGLSGTWYSQPVNGIIRLEAEYFRDEEAFIPQDNLNPLTQVPPKALGVVKLLNGGEVKNHIPLTDYLRWVIGYDRFFFFQPLNPTNSFVLSSALHGEWNVFERRGADFRQANQKPGKPAQQVGRDPRCTALAVKLGACQIINPKNFEDAYKFDSDYLTLALQTDYMHGRLEPRVVIITYASGIFGFAPSATYRITDNLLFSATYLAIESSRRALLGTFRGHDMVQLRMTVQLN